MRASGVPVVLFALCNVLAVSAADMTATIINPSGHPFEREPVRLGVNLPADAKPGAWVVRDGAAEVPSQIELVDGKSVLWVAATIGQRMQG